MSVVTNLILTAPRCAFVQLDEALRKWATELSVPPFEPVDVKAGGNRSMECRVWMGAFNYLDLDGFLAYLRDFKWKFPELVENLQLFVRGQQDDLFSLYALRDGAWEKSGKARRKKVRTPLDPNWAPEGYHAAPAISRRNSCEGCSFIANDRCGAELPCSPRERPDGLHVIFLLNTRGIDKPDG